MTIHCNLLAFHVKIVSDSTEKIAYWIHDIKTLRRPTRKFAAIPKLIVLADKNFASRYLIAIFAVNYVWVHFDISKSLLSILLMLLSKCFLCTFVTVVFYIILFCCFNFSFKSFESPRHRRRLSIITSALNSFIVNSFDKRSKLRVKKEIIIIIIVYRIFSFVSIFTLTPSSSFYPAYLSASSFVFVSSNFTLPICLSPHVPIFENIHVNICFRSVLL